MYIYICVIIKIENVQDFVSIDNFQEPACVYFANELELTFKVFNKFFFIQT